MGIPRLANLPHPFVGGGGFGTSRMAATSSCVSWALTLTGGGGGGMTLIEEPLVEVIDAAGGGGGIVWISHVSH